MFNLTQICIIDITMGTYVYIIVLVWYFFFVALNSHSKPILVKRSWNHLQKLIIQEPVLFYNHIKSATSIILLMRGNWGLHDWMSTRCGMQFLEGWYLVHLVWYVCATYWCSASLRLGDVTLVWGSCYTWELMPIPVIWYCIFFWWFWILIPYQFW
jgi:hypothetical protein